MKFSSFKKDQLLMESWRNFIGEQIFDLDDKSFSGPSAPVGDLKIPGKPPAAQTVDFGDKKSMKADPELMELQQFIEKLEKKKPLIKAFLYNSANDLGNIVAKRPLKKYDGYRNRSIRPYVVELQSFIKDFGVYNVGKSDGYYGPKTEKGVEELHNFAGKLALATKDDHERAGAISLRKNTKNYDKFLHDQLIGLLKDFVEGKQYHPGGITTGTPTVKKIG